MEDQLKSIFDQINHQLSFAEAKNAMIIVFNLTLIIAEGSLVLKDKISFWLVIILLVSISLLLISSIIVLFSFLPFMGKLEPQTTTASTVDISDINLLFYGDIAKITDASAYVRFLHSKYKRKSIEEISCIEKEYAQEIIYNSLLAVRKYKLFKYGLYFTISAISTPFIPLVIGVIKRVGVKK